VPVESMIAHTSGRFGLASHVTGDVAVGLVVLLVILGIVALASTRYRRRSLLAGAWIFGGLLAVYLVLRAVAEFFIIHYNDPASYARAWGGPSLVGVFIVHSGPGFLVLVGGAWYLWYRRHHRKSAPPARGRRPVASSRR
jgi:hypothetical protein